MIYFFVQHLSNFISLKTYEVSNMPIRSQKDSSVKREQNLIDAPTLLFKKSNHPKNQTSKNWLIQKKG